MRRWYRDRKPMKVVPVQETVEDDDVVKQWRAAKDAARRALDASVTQ